MNNDDLCFLSAVDLAAAIRSKEVSPVEVTEAVLERIDRLNPVLNCFCTSMADEARAAAKQSEAAVMRDDARGPLHGVPVSVKDIVAVGKSRTTSGSRLFEDHVSPDDAPSIERLRKSGAILIGRTTTPEFGWKGVTDSPLFGITRNPWNTELTPGGSSGGAAAAVAAGMGPIGIKAHLQPFVANHPVIELQGPNPENGAVSAAPWGSASILPISWMYIAMMGPQLRDATEVAILSANYLAMRLGEAFPVLYSGRNGRVAHECIIDLRPLKAQTGITEEDVAKRLIDYGFHAPTMSFPVPGTLMIEPTESESKAELDRFIDAMLTIRAEIRKVEQGEWTAEDNPLHNAPHTLADITGDWQRAYSREEAVFPQPWVAANKFWPSVNRIDNVFGDRNLFCACPPIESYED